MDFVHSRSTWAEQENTDINQSLRTNHGRKLDELRPCYTDKFDVYIKLAFMNHTCPLCGENLSRRKPKKVPLKGELSWLALRWRLECPFCSGSLQENQHPFEQALPPLLFLVVGLLNFTAYLSGFKASLTLVLACIALIVLGPFVGRAIVVPKDWLRYAPLSQHKR